MKLLIADDHGIVRKGLCQLIREAFPEAVIAEVSDGGALIREAGQEDWDLVISDISMPGINGLDALREMKKIKPGLPVLMVSMHSEEQYALRVFRAGASGYITKDTVHEELITAIKTLLSGQNYVPPMMEPFLRAPRKRDTPVSDYKRLSDREFNVLKMLARGKSTSAIAAELSIHITTVSTYRSRIFEKMGFTNNAELTRYALEHNLV